MPDRNRLIFHIDVNSAFLSWTALERLAQGDSVDLRTIPAIVGGDTSTRHGVVLAKSIPAKAFGITTGEPVVNALRKCPHLVMASPDHSMYREKSRLLMEHLSGICPDIEQVSIDECFLDFTGISHRYPSPYAAARYIKDEIHSRFGFTVNVGISSNKLLAKMASDFEKPDKIHTLFPDEIPQKMWPLPIGELFMAGKSSVKALNNLGIRTIGELAASDPKLITLNLKSHGTMLWNYANGIDNSPVCSTPAEAKGIGNSTTLSCDLTKECEAVPILHIKFTVI
jgi:DNA polymerase-4